MDRTNEPVYRARIWKVFIADTEATAKLYDGDGEDSTIIDDCIEITGVEISEVATDYLKYPSNKLPTTTIRLESGVFTKGDQNVAVTAKWGYSEEVPSDIELAATTLASLIIEEAWQSEGETESESIGNYSITYRKTEKNKSKLDRAIAVLNSYRRINI